VSVPLWQFREVYEDGDASSWPLNLHTLDNNLLCKIGRIMSNGRCPVIVDGTPKMIVSITITKESL
jgi:hypothetical protein